MLLIGLRDEECGTVPTEPKNTVDSRYLEIEGTH